MTFTITAFFHSLSHPLGALCFQIGKLNCLLIGEDRNDLRFYVCTLCTKLSLMCFTLYLLRFAPGFVSFTLDRKNGFNLGSLVFA